MSTLQGSVGRNGMNRAEDVILVQQLLNRFSNLPGVPLRVDGDIGPRTIDAIEAFQRVHLGMQQPDGRVDPGGRTLAALAAAPAGEDWSGDSSQWSDEKKLRSLHAAMRPKVDSLLARLAARGFRPRIFSAWRSMAVQRQLYEAGRSKVTFSFHNATRPDGHPEALAVDVIDARYGWEDRPETQAFWNALGEESESLGLYWGGSWTGFKDYAHVQFYDNNRLAEIRRQNGL